MLRASIEKLPLSTRSKLRSTQILSSLPQIVTELVQNSLDANASHVDVGLDCEGWSCWVKDDGQGIKKEELKRIGNEDGGRYRTSKNYGLNSLETQPTFGFRGEALASCAELSCLEISSRTAPSRETWSIIVKEGNTLYTGPSIRWKRESAGTTVCIRDAFYNLPVRRLSHPSPIRTWELVRQEIEAYALAFPEVAFTLEDTHAKESNLIRHMRIPKTSSTLASFQHLYGSALTKHVETVEITSGQLRVDGFISLHGAYSKAYQFIYINRHPIQFCDIQRLIDLNFTSSSFPKNALDEAGETGMPRSNVRRSPRKTEKKPVYVLNISVPLAEVDNCLEPSKNAVHLQNRTSVLSMLEVVVQNFLLKHGFNPKGNERDHCTSKRTSPSPRKRRKVDDDEVANQPDQLNDPSKLIVLNEPVAADSPTILFASTPGDYEEILWIDKNTNETFYVDTRTGNSYRQTEPPPGDTREDDSRFTTRDPSARRTFTLLPREPEGSENISDDKADPSPVPEWLQRALQENKVYAMNERKIHSVTHRTLHGTTTKPASSALEPKNANASLHTMLTNCCPSNDDSIPNVLERRFSSDDLRDAQIISQLDRKFIACILSDGSSQRGSAFGDHTLCQALSTLVLVDQHAADERVRVEQFLKELCLGFLHSQEGDNDPKKVVQTRTLIPAHPVLLTQHEVLRIQESKEIQDAFRYWGFRFQDPSQTEGTGIFDVPDTENSSGYIQLLVSSVPEVLLQGDELRDLIKGYLAQMSIAAPAMSQTGKNGSNVEPDDFSWLKALRWCPRELLDLINSKACRGAIMFNDSLSLDQCRRLVRQLSETAYPFQCAHGRPSLVPLADIGAVLEGKGRRRRDTQYNWTRLETERKP